MAASPKAWSGAGTRVRSFPADHPVFVAGPRQRALPTSR